MGFDGRRSRRRRNRRCKKEWKVAEMNGEKRDKEDREIWDHRIVSVSRDYERRTIARRPVRFHAPTAFVYAFVRRVDISQQRERSVSRARFAPANSLAARAAKADAAAPSATAFPYINGGRIRRRLDRDLADSQRQRATDYRSIPALRYLHRRMLVSMAFRLRRTCVLFIYSFIY